MGIVEKISLVRRRFALARKIRDFPVLQIHFGCGKFADSRFLNVDSRVFDHVDYVTDSPFMPALPAKSAELIYASHALEHVSHLNQINVLKRWHEILKPGGQLLLSVPDFEKVSGSYHRGETGFKQTQAVLMGGQNYAGNFHYALFTSRHLTKILEIAGFCKIQDWHPRNLESWPEDWSWHDGISLNLKAEKPQPAVLE